MAEPWRAAVYLQANYIHHEKPMNASTPTPGGPVVGLEAIGRLFGRTRWTIRRWIDEEDFPAAWLPNGQWCTTTTLIDQWLLDRAEAQRGE